MEWTCVLDAGAIAAIDDSIAMKILISWAREAAKHEIWLEGALVAIRLDGLLTNSGSAGSSGIRSFLAP